MKHPISIPDELSADVERLADQLQTSRSELCIRAITEFVARHDDERITATFNQVVDEAGESAADGFATRAADQALRRSEW